MINQNNNQKPSELFEGENSSLRKTFDEASRKNYKNIKIDIRPQHHFICNECTMKEVHTVIFYNNDDNICIYCSSKNTEPLMQCRLKAELFNYEGRLEAITKINV